MTNDHHVGRARDTGLSAMLVLALLAFLDALFEYFNSANGIHGSEGALLVVVSTALMAVAAALILFRIVRGGWRGLFEMLLVLDFVGTALAAYFLEAWVLLGLVVFAVIAWLLHVVAPRRALLEART